MRDWRYLFPDLKPEPIKRIAIQFKLDSSKEHLLATLLHKIHSRYRLRIALEKAGQDSEFRKYIKSIQKSVQRIAQRTQEEEKHVNRLLPDLANRIAHFVSELDGEKRQNYGFSFQSEIDADGSEAYWIVRQWFNVSTLVSQFINDFPTKKQDATEIDVARAKPWLTTKALPELYFEIFGKKFKISQKDGEVICNEPVQFACLAASAIGYHLTPPNLLKHNIRAKQ